MDEAALADEINYAIKALKRLLYTLGGVFAEDNQFYLIPSYLLDDPKAL